MPFPPIGLTPASVESEPLVRCPAEAVGPKLVGMNQPALVAPPKARQTRWERRPALAAVLRSVILLIPIGLSLSVTALLRSLLPRPHGTIAWVAWWVALLTAGVATAVLFERLGRRLMPLVMLLKLSMLFPDQAPSRFAVAVRAGSVRRLRDRLHEADGPDGREA